MTKRSLPGNESTNKGFKDFITLRPSPRQQYGITPLTRKISPQPSDRIQSWGFFLICFVHSAIALTCGSLMMFQSREVCTFSHGIETATKLVGSTPLDELLIGTSDSFSGLLLLAIGFILFMVSLVKDREFQMFFAKGCTLLHVFMALWRLWFERSLLEDLASDCLRETVAHVVFGLSWVLFLVYSWAEKYD